MINVKLPNLPVLHRQTEKIQSIVYELRENEYDVSAQVEPEAHPGPRRELVVTTVERFKKEETLGDKINVAFDVAERFALNARVVHEGVDIIIPEEDVRNAFHKDDHLKDGSGRREAVIKATAQFHRKKGLAVS